MINCYQDAAIPGRKCVTLRIGGADVVADGYTPGCQTCVVQSDSIAVGQEVEITDHRHGIVQNFKVLSVQAVQTDYPRQILVIG